MLFSEPKIPQSPSQSIPHLLTQRGFSALQRAENSSIDDDNDERDKERLFQCSSASRKFLNRRTSATSYATTSVSVLFSEPKIPQSCAGDAVHPRAPLFQCSSASRKFLNRLRACEQRRDWQWFQCSSASRKFLNSTLAVLILSSSIRFSALQRAENSSINVCAEAPGNLSSFSALQRAENSSINPAPYARNRRCGVSVLFSEPKIPQLKEQSNATTLSVHVSVLFSEPKIPQLSR